MLFERALRATDGSEEERLRAKYWLSKCFLMLGRNTEALALFREVYVTAQDHADHELAYRSFFNQIDALRCIQKIEGTETSANLTRRLELIEEGLLWLHDIGRETWRAPILWQQSWALGSLGKVDRALDVAEEAYRVQKQFNGQDII